MYAIAFDLKVARLRAHYPGNTPENGYAEIGAILAHHGFTRQQGSVYFGNPKVVDAVKTVIAIQDVAAQLPWFTAAVEDVRMLRIEENNDLSVALPAAPREPKPGPDALFDASSEATEGSEAA